MPVFATVFYSELSIQHALGQFLQYQSVGDPFDRKHKALLFIANWLPMNTTPTLFSCRTLFRFNLPVLVHISRRSGVQVPFCFYIVYGIYL